MEPFDCPGLAGDLLASLELTLGTSGLAYAEPPVRMRGGMDTDTFAFSLRSDNPALPDQLGGRLVLRLFNRAGDAPQAKREAGIQNALADSGYPCPRVHVVSTEGVNGRPFNVMDRVEGVPMMAEANLDPATISALVRWFATLHSRLHAIPPRPIIAAFQQVGLKAGDLSAVARLRLLEPYFQNDLFRPLEPVYDWFRLNMPPPRDLPAICHGDFHPGNIIVNDSDVAGIIDWPAATVADQEFDIGTTLVLIKVGAVNLEPQLEPFVRQIADLYLQTYASHRAIDMDRVAYYEAMRGFRAYLRGCAQGLGGDAGSLSPRDNYPWGSDFSLSALRDIVRSATGLEVPSPNRRA